jgi:hypothetical protein
MSKTNELEDFFKGLPAEDNSKADIFGDKKDAVKAESSEAKSEEDEPKKNRHYRRWEAKYQQERESAIELAARLQEKEEQIRMLTEAQKFQKSVGGDVNDPGLREWLRIYGDKPEHREAYEVFKTSLLGPIAEQNNALKQELEEIKNRDKVMNQEVRQFESFIDSQVEAIEDKYGVDLTSPTSEKTRSEFFDLIKELSPKDDEGNITSYADFDAAFRLYQAQKSSSDNTSQKRNEIASRSMANSGTGTANAAPKRTPGFMGWKKDLRL